MMVKESNALFPVFLKLEQLSILIVGGGAVALEKLSAVLHNSPLTPVRLVGTVISDEIKQLAAEFPAVQLEERPFENSDVEGADVAIIAINDSVKSAEIRDVIKQAGKLVNVADKPELCDFYLSSIVQKGNIKIAISTNGKSPTIAKRLKEVLNNAIPAEIDEVADNMQVIRTRLNGNFAYKVKRLNKLTKSLVENENEEKEKWRRIATYILIAFGLMLLGHFIFSYIPLQAVADSTVSFYHSLDQAFLLMILAGFLAQMVDGATSMGYGVTSAIVLMSANVSPAAISGSIHTAEIFASGASGYSHYRFGNVNKKMFKALLIPGVVGAVLGAYILVKFGETHIAYVRPIMAVYTLFLGIKIFINAFKNNLIKKKFKHYGWLAGVGGFLDSFGGGGWGPIVTSTLITKGRTPRFVVGSVSLTEFFVTVASAFTFFTMIGVQHWQVILGLVLGGLIASPFAARLNGKIPKKASFILLGTVVVIWSVRILVKVL
ncbi:MAG TPA: TSUP family transporter [Flavisolibacter sp.]|jgi:hypothetical protein|nr:TSUP family transporter [Flavisolibacter sp.]